MTYIMVDVESNGPCPGLYSMIEVAAINCDDPTDYFTGKLSPICATRDEQVDAALKAINRTDFEIWQYPHPAETMQNFLAWVKKFKQPMFISDNNGFDWQFVNYYFWYVCKENPFGHSSTNLNSLYKGYVRNTRKNCKHLRKTKHTHTALDDAMGNVEAFNTFRKQVDGSKTQITYKPCTCDNCQRGY